MNKLEFPVAMRVLAGTVKGTRHPYYDRVTKLADKYRRLVTGEDIEPLLMQFNPREDNEMFEQRKRITKTIVGAVSGKVKGPFEKVARSNNVTKKFVFKDEETEDSLEDLLKVLEGYWGDETLDDYMEQRMIDLSFSDPNAFIITEMKTVNDEVYVYPFEVSSSEAVNFHYSNNSLDYLVVYDGDRKYTMYTSDFFIVLVEKKDEDNDEEKKVVVPGTAIDLDTDPTDIGNQPEINKIKIGSKWFEIRVIQNICEEIPAIRVGYKRDEITYGNTYVSPMHKAIPRLEKIIKSDSELDLVISLHAFPQKLQYAQKCSGDIAKNEVCDGGIIRTGQNKGNKCGKCGGTGFLFHTTAQSALTYELPPQEELNAGANVPDLDKLITYKHPDISIIDFENRYTRQLEEEVIKDVFISQNFERSNGTATATEIEYDMDSIYDTLYPFARKFSAVYKKQVRISACYVELDKGLKVVHRFPKDFKLKTISQLLAERKAAEDANAPEFFKNQLDIDIAEKIFHDQPIALNKFRVKQQHLPFAGKSIDQINNIVLSNRSTKENVTLWIEFENIMKAIEDEQFSKGMVFYDMPYAERKALIDEKVKEIIEMKANESGVNLLDIPEDTPTEE
jgi:hypothetical protein